MKRDLRGRCAVVTGASAGIGREIALELARRQVKLLLLARNAERLQDVVRVVNAAGSDAEAVVGDITNPQVRQELVQRSMDRMGGLDLLVNNAGVGRIGSWEECTAEELRHLVEVNLVAPIELTKAALPFLKQGKQSLIVNIGSVLGYFSVPFKGEYGATKFALRGFSDAVRAELLPHGVDVLYVAPSTTQTEFFDKAQTGRFSLQLNDRNSMRPVQVAHAVVRAMEQGRQELILSVGGRGLVWLHRFFPKWGRWAMSRFTPRPE